MECPWLCVSGFGAHIKSTPSNTHYSEKKYVLKNILGIHKKSHDCRRTHNQFRNGFKSYQKWRVYLIF